MSTSTAVITADAHDPKEGMTLAGLIAFVQDCERYDIPRETPVRVTAGFNGKIKTIRTLG